MKHPIIFLWLLIFLIITQASAITVVGSRFSDAVQPGEVGAYTTVVSASEPGEIGMQLTISTDAGNCSEWLTPDKETISLTSAGAPIITSVKVPADAFNGAYACKIQYTAPMSGAFQSRVSVPISLMVTGGSTRPEVTATVPKPIIPKITLSAPIAEATPMNAKEAPTGGTGQPFGLWGAIAIGGMSVLFITVIAYDYRRGKR